MCELPCQNGGYCVHALCAPDVWACACPSSHIGYLCQLPNPYTIYRDMFMWQTLAFCFFSFSLMIYIYCKKYAPSPKKDGKGLIIPTIQ